MAKNFYTNIGLVDTTPTAPNHLVTMEWVEQFVIGKVKLPVRAVSVFNIAGAYLNSVFTVGTTGALVIDGVTLGVGDRVLIAGQTDGTQNGIYVVHVAGGVGTNAELKRADDWDTNDQIFTGVRIDVNEGTLFGNTKWSLVTTGTLLIDVTAMSFVQVAAPTGAAKYAETIVGDGVEDTFDIEHNFGSEDIIVSVYDLTTGAEIGVDIIIEDANTVVVGFDTAPTSAESFRVVVIG